MKRVAPIRKYRCHNCGSASVICEDHICTDRIYHTRVDVIPARRSCGARRTKLIKTAHDQHVSRRIYCGKCMTLLADMEGPRLYEHLKKGRM